MDRFCKLCFMLVFVVMSCLFFVALWSPAGKGLTSWLSCVLYFVTFTDRSKAALLLWIVFVSYASCWCLL